MLRWEAPGPGSHRSSTDHHCNARCISAHKLGYFSAASEGAALPISYRNISTLSWAPLYHPLWTGPAQGTEQRARVAKFWGWFQVNTSAPRRQCDHWYLWSAKNRPWTQTFHFLNKRFTCSIVSLKCLFRGNRYSHSCKDSVLLASIRGVWRSPLELSRSGDLYGVTHSFWFLITLRYGWAPCCSALLNWCRSGHFWRGSTQRSSLRKNT